MHLALCLIAVTVTECSEKCAKGNIWAQEGQSNRRMKEMHDVELHNLYSSQNIEVRKSRIIRWKDVCVM
jgi:hypothetical protein